MKKFLFPFTAIEQVKCENKSEGSKLRRFLVLHTSLKTQSNPISTDVPLEAVCYQQLQHLAAMTAVPGRRHLLSDFASCAVLFQFPFNEGQKGSYHF